jgi:shikimate kinase
MRAGAASGTLRRMSIETRQFPERLFIVGPMAAGKSAVGRRLASRLSRPFHDTDSVIEARTGVDIEYIFDREGEAGFRRRERAVVAELSALTPVVLSTGGGAILDPDSRRLLAERGTIIYLSATVASQLARTRHTSNRPLLRTDDPEGTLDALAAVRTPIYEAMADITVPTDGEAVDAVVGRVMRALREGADDGAGGAPAGGSPEPEA